MSKFKRHCLYFESSQIVKSPPPCEIKPTFSSFRVWDKFKKADIIGLMELLFEKAEKLIKGMQDFQSEKSMSAEQKSATGQFLMDVSNTSHF